MTFALKDFLRRGALTAAFGLCFAAIAPAHADAIDDLLDKLKEKGVITQEEFDTLKDSREGERAVDRRERKESDIQATKQEEIDKTGMQGWFRDGLTFESADKKNSFGITGRIQLDYRDFTGDDAVGADTFDIRRAYLGVQGKFWEYYTFDVTADFASLTGPTAAPCATVNVTTGACATTVTTATTNSSHLDVAWLNVGWWKWAQFRFGQFKMPFSIEELTSSRFIDFQERSFVNALVPAKERGIMVHGEPVTGLFYGLAFSTGQGKNTNDTNNIVDKNDLIGRVAVNFAQMFNLPNTVLHLGLGYTTGEIPVAATPSFRTEARGNTIFTTRAFTGDDVERERQGVEASVAWGPVKLQAEMVKANFSGSNATDVSYDRDIEAMYASVNWLITGEKYSDSYRGGAYGAIRPKKNFSPTGGGAGAWELGLRYSKYDATDFTTTNVAGTGVLAAGTSEAEGFTVGLKWILNPNTRFLLNYIKTEFEEPLAIGGESVDEEEAYTFRAQFHF